MAKGALGHQPGDARRNECIKEPARLQVAGGPKASVDRRDAN
jgi:hypothetical protein